MDYTESIEKSKEYIKNHINDIISAEEIAGSVGYSVFHFCRIFKKYNGKSLMRYVRDAKLENASEEIKTGEKIGNIAENCGYETLGGFSRAYKRKYGKNPSGKMK